MDTVNTLRILVDLSCNFKCKYCCNCLPEVRNSFERLSRVQTLNAIRSPEYENICISGGEPFYSNNRFTTHELLKFVSLLTLAGTYKNIYLYTNAVLIGGFDVYHLEECRQLKGINIGIHSPNQIKHISRKLLNCGIPIRFRYWEGIAESVLANGQGYIRLNNSKIWKMDECIMPNERMVLIDEQ